MSVTDTAGNVLERNSYDTWGVRRDPVTLTPYAPGEQPELTLGRGYGSHEHLGDFGLINMNARLYDPALCRFLSPDPVVQSPFTPQNLNRYAFCLNNPLRYTDPSGMFTKTHINGDMYINLDDVYVIGTRTIPNPWLQYYSQILPRVQYNVFDKNKQTASDGNGFFNTGGLVYGVSSNLQYNEFTETWIGKNGKLYKGLKGKGPNKWTGSRSLAKNKAKNLSKVSRAFSYTGTFVQWGQYATSKDGPNMKAYLLHKAQESTILLAIQESPWQKLYTTVFCLTYSLAQFVQDCGIHIRYNPYTHDFTPIEETLRYYDSIGVRIYY